jgi:hypothetical protein
LLFEYGSYAKEMLDQTLQSGMEIADVYMAKKYISGNGDESREPSETGEKVQLLYKEK